MNRKPRAKKLFERGRCAALAAAVAAAIAAAAEPAAAQPACGDRIGPNEAVVLARNLVCDEPGDAIEVEGPAVLDLNGFAIHCSDANGNGRVSAVGIRVSGTGAIVRGGHVIGCGIGILLGGEGRHRVETMRVVSTVGDGILVPSDRNQVLGSAIFFPDADGFDVFGEKNLLAGNAATGTGEFGFRVGGGNVLRNNIAAGNPGAGFLISGKKSVLVENRATDNARGFTVIGQKNRLVENEAEGNAAGVLLDGPATGNTLTKNELNGNDFAGLFVLGSGNKLSRNRAEGNGDFGILLIGSVAKTVVTRTVARNNGDTDLVDEAAEASGGCAINRWKKNEFGSSNHPCIE